MDRRSFLKNTALGGTAAAAASTLAAPAISQGREVLTMVTTWPRGLAGVWDSVERVVNNVADLTDGTLTIDAKGAGELVGAFESFDAAASGQADAYHGADYYWIGQNPAWAFFTAVPFGMTVPEIMTWYYGGEGAEMHRQVAEVFNVRSFIAGQTGPQGGGWFRNEITGAGDLQGLKFRMPGLGGEALSKIGVSVQVLPGGEIYQALSTGALDGTEWIGPWSDERLGLQEVCKHYYPAGMHEPGAALSVGVNLERFNGLSKSHQRAIEVACADAHQHNYSLFTANNGPALQRLLGSGVSVHEFPADVWDAFGTGAREVLGGYRGDPLYDMVYESAMKSMRETSAWLSLADTPYVRERTRVMSDM